MNKSIILAAMMLSVAWPTTTIAQEILDLSVITCKQFLNTDPDKRALIGSWMSGYFSAANNLNMVNFTYVERNKKVVGTYCKSHPNETLMSAIQKKAK